VMLSLRRLPVGQSVPVLGKACPMLFFVAN
jgi:hypothetical protein